MSHKKPAWIGKYKRYVLVGCTLPLRNQLEANTVEPVCRKGSMLRIVVTAETHTVVSAVPTGSVKVELSPSEREVVEFKPQPSYTKT